MATARDHKHILRPPIDLTFQALAATAIESGQMLWWDEATLALLPLSTVPAVWSSEAQQRRLVVSRFAGVADFTRRTTDLVAKSFAVKSGAIYEMPCAATVWKYGDMVGPVKDAAGNYLSATLVARVVHPYEAIGYCTKSSASATTVQCMLFSAFDWMYCLRNTVQRMVLGLAGGRYTAGGNMCVDYEFNTRVRLLAIEGLVETLTVLASTGTASKGAGALTDTLVIADAQAVASIHRVEFTDATNEAAEQFFFDYGDDFDFAIDATPTAGDVLYTVEYMNIPFYLH